MGKLGSGSFGSVVLSRHNYSGMKFAIKSIEKVKIENAFVRNNQKFCELQIMEEVCRGECPNLVELIETFADETHYYIVTKLHPEGDLLKYLIKNKQRPLAE
jgi:serine/threonine protein kinase